MSSLSVPLSYFSPSTIRMITAQLTLVTSGVSLRILTFPKTSYPDFSSCSLPSFSISRVCVVAEMTVLT